MSSEEGWETISVSFWFRFKCRAALCDFCCVSGCTQAVVYGVGLSHDVEKFALDHSVLFSFISLVVLPIARSLLMPPASVLIISWGTGQLKCQLLLCLRGTFLFFCFLHNRVWICLTKVQFPLQPFYFHFLIRAAHMRKIHWHWNFNICKSISCVWHSFWYCGTLIYLASQMELYLSSPFVLL